VHQDIRELHIGLLNMMPDAALAATEQQFITLVGSCNQIAQFYVYPFSLPQLARGAEAQAHIDRHYLSFEQLREQGLDALIISGANVANPRLEQEPFWEPLTEVVAWAHDNLASTLCSCLASHALLKHLHGIERRRLPAKRWGVYPHRVLEPQHPLVRDINTRFDAPHSRYNEVSREQLQAAGLRVLAESPEAGVHLATSADGFRVVYFQGHPEYDANSLLKEYKREVCRYLEGERERPPFPEHYFDARAQALADDHLHATLGAKAAGRPLPSFPEAQLEALVDNTWRDTAKAVINNWLGGVYRTTNLDRKLQFMDEVNPDDPLGMGGQ
jgi:homoserine O-succinyltransferase